MGPSLELPLSQLHQGLYQFATLNLQQIRFTTRAAIRDDFAFVRCALRKHEHSIDVARCALGAVIIHWLNEQLLGFRFLAALGLNVIHWTVST